MIYQYLILVFILFPAIPGAAIAVSDIIEAVKRHRRQEEAEAKAYIESYVQYRIHQNKMIGR